VHIHHDVTDAELAWLYLSSLCLFFPSPHEGFGLPALEAMAAGLPVVAARAGALPEVVGDAAILVNPESPPEMAQALAQVLDSPSLAQQLAEQGKRRASLFTWQAAATRAVDAFKKLMCLSKRTDAR
jgi:alpha-1,3-rhamnosyl/mannosyltransferase